MHVDKDDRYVAEANQQNQSQQSSLLDFFSNLSKNKIIVLGFVFVIFLLLISLLIFSSSNDNESELLTPTAIVNNLEEDEQDAELKNQQSVISNDSEIDSVAQTTSTLTNTVIEKDELINLTAPPTDINQNSTGEQLNNSTFIHEQHKPALSEKPLIKETQIISEPKKVVKTDKDSSEKQNPQKIANNHFALQLSASSSEENLKKFVKRYHLTNTQIYSTKQADKNWFILIQGNYASVQEAKKSISALPADVQKNKPWVKSGTIINKEKAVK